MKARCPSCGAPTSPRHQPFCGPGCKDRDLLNWLSEGYRIPGPAADPDLLGAGVEAGVDKADGAD